MIDRLARMVEQRERVIVGLMSGTSMDGIDAAVVRVRGSGIDTTLELLAFQCHPYECALRQRLLDVAGGDAVPALDLARLDAQVAASFAQAALRVIDAAALTPEQVDLIGSHGQTLAHHAPGAESCDPAATTWQAGNIAALAAQAGVPVIGDFRSADIALGGTGAPLVPYVDFVLRRSTTESRLLVNIGGIANVTYLRAAGRIDEVLAWDVGPGNMVLDACSEHLLGAAMDADGAAAARGTADATWVDELLHDDFFQRAAPKTAGREQFGNTYTQRLLREGERRGLRADDVLATTAELTARSIAQARWSPPLARLPLDAVYLAGGGRRNAHLARRLADLLQPAQVRGFEALGLDADAKEAVDFAVLANEALFGHATNLTQVTGAQRPCVLGSLALAGMMPRAQQTPTRGRADDD